MILTAFLIGLLGSVHCVGMCGPLTITFSGQSGKSPVASFTLYHLARMFVYAIIGIAFGLIGTSLQLIHIQRAGAIILGITLILMYSIPGLRNKVEGMYYRSSFFQWTKQRLTLFYGSRIRWLAAGMVNGFLPCGLIYLAAAGAILSGSVINAALYMLIFGLGTLPALIGVAWLNKRIQPGKNFSRTVSWVAILSGGILIARGVVVSDPHWNQQFSAHINQVIVACGF